MNRTVFIAGPMSTSGEPGPNLNAAAVAAADLLLAGLFPFVPHVNWILHAVRPDVKVKMWQECDLVWLALCHAVLRLPGDSRGSDKEVTLAEKRHIPVFFDIESLKEYFQ